MRYPRVDNLGARNASCLHENEIGGIGFLIWPPSGRHLEQHHAKTVDIGAFVAGPAHQLLGRHIGRRTRLTRPERSRDRGRIGRGRRRDRRRMLGRVRDAEIEHLHAPFGRDLDVRRLQIAVDDPSRVGGGERRRQLPPDGQHPVDWQALAFEPRRQALAFDVLHHDEGAILVLDDVVNRGDVGMGHARGGAGFGTDPFLGGLIGGERADDAFQRHFAPQPRIVAEKDVAHAAAADRIDDHVRPDLHSRLDVVGRVARIRSGRLGEEIAAVAGEHGDDLAGERRIAALLADEPLSFRRRPSQRGGDDRLRLFPRRSIHFALYDAVRATQALAHSSATFI